MKRIKWPFVLLAFLLMLGGTFVVWGLTPLGPSENAKAALRSDASVLVREGKYIEFIPRAVDPETGFIIYPGGRVDWRSYAPIARQIALQGYYVAITSMPLSLAVLAPGSASKVLAAHLEIKYWAVGGHSLGGAMAANFAYHNPGTVRGLVLWAAYPAESNNISDNHLKVVSISASLDGLATKAKIDASQGLLPSDTRWVVIEGGNHAQFGSYGAQPGDGKATISAVNQMDQITSATVELLKDLAE